MLRRGLVLDLSVAFGLGTSAGYLWWYGMFLSLLLPPNSLPSPSYFSLLLPFFTQTHRVYLKSNNRITE